MAYQKRNGTVPTVNGEQAAGTMYVCVGTVGLGVFPVRLEGEPFRGLLTVYRRGSLDQAEVFFAYLVDKNTLPEPAPYPHDWSDPARGLGRWIDLETGEAVADPDPVSVVGLATEEDYYGRILPGIRRLER